jgi:radical SAM protein with 4Fe4S-binding SPASM domain
MVNLFHKVHEKLPVFLIPDGKEIVLYTPGYSQKLGLFSIQEIKQFVNSPQNITIPELIAPIHNIINKAHEAVNNWELKKQKPFSPECLTIHSGSDCNLNCSYCYSKVEKTTNTKITGFPDLNSIEIACRQIAEIRQKDTKQMTVVFHGSGEPTYHWPKLVEAHSTIKAIAQEYQIKLFTYIATNGTLTEKQIDWLILNFDLIGISCDGPPAIHEKQRGSGNLSTEEVCNRIFQKNGRFEIRATITPESLCNLLEITEYLINPCKTKTIRIEPVYLNKNGFSEPQADEFSEQFFKSLSYASSRGVSFTYAGVRLNEQHSTYCDVLRNTYRITSDGNIRNCFCYMYNKDGFINGTIKNNPLVVEMNPAIKNILQLALSIPEDCAKCINIYHCSRGCPEFCFFNNGDSSDISLNKFRCRMHQLLAVEQIKRLSKYVNHPI